MTPPFYLEKRRAMISLGPVSSKRHCSFKCPFCYVKSDEFNRYEGWTIEKIISWLEDNLDDIDIIYISADTDSFAKPRTSDGLLLLQGISKLKRDVLFTTRYVFTENELKVLRSIADTIRRSNKLSIACVSICQMNSNYLEPFPIDPPLTRIELLGDLKKNGWIPILAMRPILPQVQSSDYDIILTLSAKYISNCLISSYYYDPNSPQLDALLPGKQIGNLFFNTKESNKWMVIEPSNEVMESIVKSAERNNIKLFTSSNDMYKSILSRK